MLGHWRSIKRRVSKPKHTKKHIKKDFNRYFVKIFWKFWTLAKFRLLIITFERVEFSSSVDMIQGKYLKNPGLQT